MPTYHFSSISDQRLDPYRNLRYATTAQDEGLFIAEGRWLTIRLLQSQLRVHSVLVEQRRVSDVESSVSEDVALYVIPDKATESLVGFNFHRGVLSCGFRPSMANLEDVQFPTTSTIVVGCRIQDPENMGLMLRNCSAFGVDAMLIGPASVDPFSRRVLRVSMGNAFFVKTIVVGDLEEALGRLRQRGFDVAATVLDEKAAVLMDASREPRQAIVFGEEAHGITPSCIKACDRTITLPMKNKTDSLNVAVASGVFLYHMTSAARDDGSRS